VSSFKENKNLKDVVHIEMDSNIKKYHSEKKTSDKEKKDTKDIDILF